MFRLLRVAIPIAVLLVTACLFSTTAPKPSPDGENPPPDVNTAGVVGQILHYGTADHTYRRTPDRGVYVLALGPDRDANGELDVLGHQLVISDRSGTYRATLRHPTLIAVELKAYTCDYDPANSDLDCCLDMPPCSPSICNIWTSPRRYSLSLGQTLQQEVIVPCRQ